MNQRKLTVSTSEWMTTIVETLPDGHFRTQPIEPLELAAYLGDRWQFIGQEDKPGRTVQIYERSAV